MILHKIVADHYCVVFFKSSPSPPVINEATASLGRDLVCVIYMQFPWAEVDRREFYTDVLFTAKPFILLEAGSWVGEVSLLTVISLLQNKFIVVTS